MSQRVTLITERDQVRRIVTTTASHRTPMVNLQTLPRRLAHPAPLAAEAVPLFDLPAQLHGWPVER